MFVVFFFVIIPLLYDSLIVLNYSFLDVPTNFEIKSMEFESSEESEITNVSTNQLAHPDTLTPNVTTVPSSQHQPTISSQFTTEQVQKLMINFNNNHDLQQRFHLEGRSFTYDIATKRKHIIIKFYIPLSTTTDIPPTYLTIESLAYALINQCKVTFDVDITAILNFNDAVKTK